MRTEMAIESITTAIAVCDQCERREPFEPEFAAFPQYSRPEEWFRLTLPRGWRTNHAVFCSRACAVKYLQEPEKVNVVNVRVELPENIKCAEKTDREGFKAGVWDTQKGEPEERVNVYPETPEAQALASSPADGAGRVSFRFEPPCP